METITAPFDEVLGWLLDTVVVRPGLPELVAEHDPLIISAGLPRADRAGPRAGGRRGPVVANRIEAVPAGWRSVFLERDACAVCGEPCKRVALAGTGAVRLRRRRRLRPLRLARGRAGLRPRRPRARTSTRRASRTSPSRTSHDIREALADVRHGAGRAYDRRIALLALPQPYDFLASTERFRSYGADRANVWHDGGLHRVVAGREVRIEAAPGGVEVEPCDDDDRAARRAGCSARRSTSSASGRGRAAEPALAALRSRSPATGRRSSRIRGRCSSP